MKQHILYGLWLALFTYCILYLPTAPRLKGAARSSNTGATSLPLSASAPAGSHEAAIQRTQYNGWSVYKLTNGIVSLLLAPDLGGRAIQMQLGDQDYFFVNKYLAGKVLPAELNNSRSGWANYGGDKVWPAPQGSGDQNEWPGPPYYMLDGSKFGAEVVTEAPFEVAVRVTSPRDPQTGIQFVRTFHVYAGTTRIKVEQVMRNISRRQIRWGIWHVLQNDGADATDPMKPNPELYMYVPLNPHSKYREGYYKLVGDVHHPSYEVLRGENMLRVHYLYQVGKVGTDTDRGWYAVVNGQKNIGYVETFHFFPGMEYPEGSSVESWNNGPPRIPDDPSVPADPKKLPLLLEAEVLSPFAELDPGEEYSFPVYWSPTRVVNPIRDANWAGAISEPLTGNVDGDRIRLKGIFGVFTPGMLEAVFYDRGGEELSRETLQAIDPREVVRLDKLVKVPSGAFRVNLLVRDSMRENCGFLGNIVLSDLPRN
jgi:hypothetical protein